MEQMFGIEHLCAMPPSVSTGLRLLPRQQGTWPSLPRVEDRGENEKRQDLTRPASM